MNAAEDKNLMTLESELRHIARLVQGFDSDFERVDAIGLSVERALVALLDIAAPSVEEVPAGVKWHEAA